MITPYDTPARPWAFGPFITTDVVGQEGEALVQRYDLLDALMLDGVGRRDIMHPQIADPRLREQMLRQLVSGVDLEPADGAGWPIRAGVRLEAFCYSPWLDDLRDADGTIDGRKAFTVPADIGEFVRQFETRSGIGPGLDIDMRAALGWTPTLLGQIAFELPNSDPPLERAYRALLSREFDLAVACAPGLKDPHSILERSGFYRPAIEAFEEAAELARIGMIVRDVGRCAHLHGPTFGAMLERANDPAFVAAQGHPIGGVAYSPEIAEALAGDSTLLRLCEYLAVGTDVLASWHNAVKADRGTFLDGFRPAALLAGGSMSSDTATALIWMVDVRTAFLSALRSAPDAGRGSRQSALENDIVFKFYGMTNWSDNLASTLMADFQASRPKGRPRKDVVVVKREDPRPHQAAIIARIGRTHTQSRMPSINNVREGSWLSKLFLPAKKAPGSAPRGNAALWRDRYRDQAFWARYANADPAWLDDLNIAPADRKRLNQAMMGLRDLASSVSSNPSDPLAARAVCDLACAVGPISANPAFARAIVQLSKFNAHIGRVIRRRVRRTKSRKKAQRLMDAKFPNRTFGTRYIPVLYGFAIRFLGRRPK